MVRRKSKGSGDGGYYAIKGFLYQFDKALIEVLENTNVTVTVEGRQDIECEDWMLQVKHKATQDYADSKIRDPVVRLIREHMQRPDRELCLYCHFRDRQPEDWRLSDGDLVRVLGQTEVGNYPVAQRGSFLMRFRVRFSEDYDTQFGKTLGLIRAKFGLPDKREAIVYHAIFRSRLLDLSVRKSAAGRRVCYGDLRQYAQEAEAAVFWVTYRKHMGRESYATAVRKTHFTFRQANIENFERLFAIDCDPDARLTDLQEVASRVARRFYKSGKSPQPYVVFRGATDDTLRKVKQGLWDQGVRFADGTHFDGDRFRLDDLLSAGPGTTLRLVPLHEVKRLAGNVSLREVYDLFLDEPLKVRVSGRRRQIQIEKTSDILQMID